MLDKHGWRAALSRAPTYHLGEVCKLASSSDVHTIITELVRMADAVEPGIAAGRNGGGQRAVHIVSPPSLGWAEGQFVRFRWK
ncbi:MULTISPECIES: hypothetical protein [unclassified Micromonospora]|uniref:hypothetical protein n=1 Tax=unclassified Micromonospora TaxID=2617518 RepID=UPI002FF2E981